MSTTSKTGICNLALFHIGSSKSIANLETEESAEARACRLFYDDVLEEVLKARHWPFAKKFTALALVETDPTEEWKYSYRYPSDCLEVRRIIDDLTNQDDLDYLGGSRAKVLLEGSRIPFVMGQDDQGFLIFTDKQTALIEYLARVDEVVRWPADFKMAVSFLLGSYIAPRLTSGDPFRMADRCFELYMKKLDTSAANVGNEEQQKPNPDSEFIRTRQGY